MGKRRNPEAKKALGWSQRQPMMVKILLFAVPALSFLFALKLFVKDFWNLFLDSKAFHVAAIMVLIHKLAKKKTCCGLSLKAQELTALSLAVGVYNSFVGQDKIHTHLLDFIAFVSTAWIIYMMRYKLKATYIKEQDNLPLYYVVVPCAILAALIHPHEKDFAPINRMLLAFRLYLESVCVLPQLLLMYNEKLVEPFTVHYVLSLGIARFLGCAYWITDVYQTGGKVLFIIGSGNLWLAMEISAEIIQTSILVDFCYYYLKSVMYKQRFKTISLPI